MSRKTALAVAAALLVAAANPITASAGWRIKEVDPEFPDEVTTYRFQAGKVRVDGALEGLAVVVDLRKDEGWLIDEVLKRYAGGKIPALAEELRKLDSEGLPDEEAAGEEEGVAAAGPGKVTIKDLGAGERILGFETRRHQVLLDGAVIEELWVAPKVDVDREASAAAFGVALQKMLGGGADIGYENDPAYLKLRAGGYPLRQVLHFTDEESTSSIEVKAAEQASFPEADFAVPAGYKKIGYAELLVGDPEE